MKCSSHLLAVLLVISPFSSSSFADEISPEASKITSAADVQQNRREEEIDEEDGLGEEPDSTDRVEESIESTSTKESETPPSLDDQEGWGEDTNEKTQGFSSAQAALEIEYDKRIAKKYRFHVVSQFSHEFLYAIEGRDHYSDDEKEKFENYLDLKELWVSMKEENFDIYFGRQIVPWGETDGLPITDLITPRDLSQFFYKNLEDMRLGMTMTRFNYYWGENTLSLITVHEFRPTRLGPEGSEFDWRPALMEGFSQLPYNVKIGSHIKPSTDTEPDLGVRLMMPGSGYDISLMAASLFDDDFVFKPVDKTFDTDDNLTGATFDLEHNRFNMVGFTANKLVDKFVLKTEMAYYQGKSFNVSSEKEVFPVEERDLANVAVGFDYTHSDQLTVTLNHQYQKILDFDNSILGQEEVNLTFANFAFSFINDSFTPSYTVFYAWEDEDFVHKVKVEYEITSGLNISAGVDIIASSDGESRTGQLEDTSRAWTELKYSF
jgi:hypothetical protein